MVGENEQVDTVSGVNAVSSIGDDVVDLIAHVDLVTTAVGPVVLERIAPAIAKGLVKRKAQGIATPLNIIACENMVRGTTQLKGHVMNALADEDKSRVEEHVGFVDSAVDRIVPLRLLRPTIRWKSPSKPSVSGLSTKHSSKANCLTSREWN